MLEFVFKIGGDGKDSEFSLSGAGTGPPPPLDGGGGGGGGAPPPPELSTDGSGSPAVAISWGCAFAFFLLGLLMLGWATLDGGTEGCIICMISSRSFTKPDSIPSAWLTLRDSFSLLTCCCSYGVCC